MEKITFKCAECGNDWPWIQRGLSDTKHRVYAWLCRPCAWVKFEKKNEDSKAKSKHYAEYYEREKTKNREKQRKMRLENKEFNREQYLLRTYGVNLQWYNEVLASQSERCAICQEFERIIDAKTGQPKLLVVDHDHKTGQVRRLLCHRCNIALGQADDSPELLRKMAAYLELHRME